MDPIRREELKMFNVASTESGYYYESLIINRTANPIMIIDHNNRKAIIEPTDGTLDGSVVAVVRSHNGARKTWSNKIKASEDVPIDSTRLIIEGWAIESGSIYVKELDVIMTNPECGHSIRHHNSRSTSHDDIVQAIQGLVNSKDGVFVHFLVNDPKERAEHIFGAFGPSNMFQMEVLSISSGMEDNATLTIVVGSKEKTHIQQIIDIEDLFESSTMILDGQTIPLALGLTAQDAIRASSLKMKDIERQVFDQVSKRMAAERSEHKERLEELKNDHKLEITELKNKQIALDAEHKKTIADLDSDLKAMSEWKVLYLQRTDVAKSDTDLRVHQLKRVEADEKMQRAKIASTNEMTKYLHTVVKIAGGVVVGVVTPWLVGKFKSE